MTEDVGEKRGGGLGNFRYHRIVGFDFRECLTVNAPFPNGEEEKPGAIGKHRAALEVATCAVVVRPVFPDLFGEKVEAECGVRRVERVA